MRLALGAIALAVAGVAHADPAPAPSTFVDVTLSVGGSTLQADPVLVPGVAGGHRVGPVRVTGGFAYTSGSDSAGPLSFLLAQAGGEVRACTRTEHLCGVAGLSAGVLHATSTDTESHVSQRANGLVAIPGLFVDVSPNQELLARIGLSLDFAVYGRHHESDRPMRGLETFAGVQLVFALGYAW